jgi:TatD DNase family protein
MQFIDTHCHIHDSEFAKNYDESVDSLIASAKDVGVVQLVCVGTDALSSQQAVDFCAVRDNCYASLALHPHEAANKSTAELTKEVQKLDEIASKSPKRLVAIGECGLDYFYHESEEVKDRQKELLKLHLLLAQKYDLPLIFHIRDAKKQDDSLGQAFADFFTIVDDYPNVGGVVHSFSATSKELDGVIKRGFYVGLNGIITFSKETPQIKAAEHVPIEKLVLETDAPFLTPKPFRGTMCKPEHLRVTAEFISNLRGETLEELAAATTANAKKLFGI